jgi:hypothetical protein
MFSELTDPLVVLSAALVTALTYPAWPKISIKIERQTCNGVRVTDIAVIVTRGSDRSNSRPSLEFSVYMIWKKRKK